MPPASGNPCIAYLSGDYPKASQTCILREITAFRSLGTRIMPASIQSPAPDGFQPRQRTGQAGRVRVRADFDVKIEVQRVFALFTGLGGTAPRPEPLEAG